MTRGIQAGDLDRRVTFERPVVTKDPTYGTSQTKWEAVVSVWAQVRDVLPSRAESMDESISIQRRPARVRIRYRTDITADMRILHEGRTLEIVAGPAELGRREGLELVVEQLSTRGEAP